MAGPIAEEVLLKSKFRGCLVGALVGDCFGAIYEGENKVSKVILNKFFSSCVEIQPGQPKFIKFPYTDDTAMTRSLAETLIQNKGYSAEDCAKRYAEEYIKSPKRGYGQSIVHVFQKWVQSSYSNIMQPAKQQFEGRGSFGNGAAMRVSPVALFHHNNPGSVISLARESALLTHTHKDGENGAILQALAVVQALNKKPDEKVEDALFLDELVQQMVTIEDTDRPYCIQLELAKRILEKSAIVQEMVVDELGNSVSALKSVPTAIYCFLAAKRQLPELNAATHFERTVQYAISLGGDTDTIASMAAAVAGAHLGLSAIPQYMQDRCEGLETTLQHADALYDLVVQAEQT